ncbi:MAG: TrkA family potassium uptake protein [Bacteroidales bacterium]|nr:TrkA family potassium uptake protein [Bacteroidales bacterium]
MSKHLIIVGAGRTGKHVIQAAIADNHDVFVIEKNEKLALELANTLDCKVIAADATSIGALEEADGKHADALVTTTNDDAVNLMVIMMGKDLGIKTLISSVNYEEHIPMFEKLNVTTVESPFRLNGQFLYHAIKSPSVKDFMDLGGGVEIIELTVGNDSPANGQHIRALNKQKLLPKLARIVVIRRNSEIIIPEGDTLIMHDDLVVLLCKEEVIEHVMDVFCKRKK